MVGFAAVVAASLVIGGLGMSGGTDRLVDTVWTAEVVTLMAVACYLLLRRAFVSYAAAVLVVAAVAVTLAPQLSDQRSGDPQLLGRLAGLQGYHALSVAVVNLDAADPVRFANTGSTPNTRFEVGSITKALTGLVIADAVSRGEVDLSVPVSTYLPLAGTSAGKATLKQLVTHTAGYPRDAPAIELAYVLDVPLGLNPASATRPETLATIRTLKPSRPGSYVYSNIGAAAAGQATAAAVGLSYPDLMRSRLFEPLGMTDTAVQTTAMVNGGYGAAGRAVQPWVMDGLAPEGAVVSMSHDLSVLATAVLTGAAPGLAALTPTTATDVDYARTGIFWVTTRQQNGHSVTWHSGETGGYTSYIGFDRAVIVLSDVARTVTGIGSDLLAE